MGEFDFLIWLLFTLLAIPIIYGVIRRMESRKKKRLQFALLAFQSHTNPHFIKNVLQAINWFILNSEKKMASDYLCDFSRLMEDILKFSKKYFVTLSEKLEFLDLYLKLQHLRHNDKFDYVPLNNPDNLEPTIKISENINPEIFVLPPLLIHPYIENAIEHGLKAKKSKGFLSVEFKFEENKLVCIVTDNGIGVKASRKIQAESKVNRSRIGIANTQKRIEIIKKLYKIKIEANIDDLNPNEAETGTVATLKFPMPMVFNPKSGMPKELYNVGPDFALS